MRRHAAGRDALDAMRAAAACRQGRRSGRLQSDDARATAARLQRARDANQHPGGAHGAAERIDRTHLLEQLDADVAVAIERVAIVELIGPERTGLRLEGCDARAETIEERRRHGAAVARYHLDVGAKRPHGVDFLARERVG